MVKNVKGGKHKNQARKFLLPSSNKKLRVKENEFEMYASVTSKLGDNKLEVLCMDGESRLCVIPGKFKSKGKRDNAIERNSWILVGIRDWETIVKDKREKCDLLEVYNENERTKLHNTVSENWKTIGNEIVKEDDLVHFTETEEEPEIFRNEIISMDFNVSDFDNI